MCSSFTGLQCEYLKWHMVVVHRAAVWILGAHLQCVWFLRKLTITSLWTLPFLSAESVGTLFRFLIKSIMSHCKQVHCIMLWYTSSVNYGLYLHACVVGGSHKLNVKFYKYSHGEKVLSLRGPMVHWQPAVEGLSCFRHVLYHVSSL